MQNDTVVGFLADALSCVVTEERNGVFELSLTYPVTGGLFPKIEIDRFVKAKPNDTADLQIFRIYEVSKPMNGVVTVNAEHVSYALSSFPVSGISMSGTATQCISHVLALVNNYLDYLEKTTPFQVSTTDMDTIKQFQFQVGSARAALGGTTGSILDVFGGEYEFDNYVIKLHKHRGRDTGIVIAYGKNMTDIKVTTSLETAYTALFPYAIKDKQLFTSDVLEFETEPALKVIEYDPVMPVENKSGIADRILIRDFTSDFSNDETITKRALAEKAEQWLKDNDINSPSVNVSVSFINLWQSPEYAELQALEQVSLCDWVTVRHSMLGVDLKAQVVKTVYDVLAERYQKMELGSARADFAGTLQKATSDITKLVNSVDLVGLSSQITQEYLAAIGRATDAITGTGYGVVRLTPKYSPTEITIANAANTTAATKVWRWNMGGLGFSPNGYNGPFTTAITAGGEIVADFITAGTLTANIIRAGILTSVNGKSSFNLESGLLKSSNIEVTGGTIKIGGDSYYTYIANGSIAQHMTSGGGLIGGLVPIGIVENNDVKQGLYCSHTATGIGIYQRKSDGSFDGMALFTKTKAYILTPLQLSGDLVMVGDMSLGGKLSIGGNISFGLAATNTLNFSGDNGIAFGGSTALRVTSGTFALGISGKSTKYYGDDLIPNSAVDLGSSSSKWGVVYASRYEVPGGLLTSGDGAMLIGTSLSSGIAIGSVSGSTVTPYLMVEKDRVVSNGNMYAPKFVVNSVENLKTNISEAGSVLDAVRNSRIYTYNLISETPYAISFASEETETEDDGVVVAQSEEETLNGASAPVVSEHTSTGFVIGRETPNAVLSEDGEHIDLYAMAALNWRATQELLERIEQLEQRIT